MKANRLISSIALLGALSLSISACIVTVEDEPLAEGGTMDLQWLLDGGCVTTDTLAVVYSESVPGACDSSTSTACYVDVFDCAQGSAITQYRPEGSYDTWIQITTLDQEGIYAVSNLHKIDVYAGATTEVDIAFPTDGGFASFQWGLYDADTNAPAMCRANETINALAAPSQGETFYAYAESCAEKANGAGQTAKMGIDEFTMTFSILDENQETQAASLPVESNISYGNEFVQLGSVEILVDTNI